MSNKHLNLGIFGFGCVGQGLHKVLQNTKGIRASIQKICIKHPHKDRPISQSYFTTNPEDILLNKDIDIVVELTDDAEAAYQIVTTALRQGKAVVTANKKLVAEHLEELYELQQTYNTPLLYEGACCASIPIIRNLEEYYDNDLLSSVEGIFNGSTNYILSQMRQEGKSFVQALSEAQEKGFAETDPTLDIGAYDPKYKLCITLLHAFGIFTKPEEIFNYGITQLNEQDISYAQQQGKTIKLLVHTKKEAAKITGLVLPTFVDAQHPLANVENEFNGILVESAFTDHQFFLGKGAGSTPTGSAVLSDISALTYNYSYEYKKLHQNTEAYYSQDQLLEVYVRYQTPLDIDLNDFQCILQRFESAEYNYLVGEINLKQLYKPAWRKNPNISIVLNKVLVNANQTTIQTQVLEEALAV
ncbi:MAG: homoserine dehydrogenase [Aureispira sp.]|nr:homoserine dehydrogenase [Aureispira sp.]